MRITPPRHVCIRALGWPEAPSVAGARSGRLAAAEPALAAAIVAPVALSAQKPVPAPTAFKTEKCYGIAKAGKNDCASTGNNSCAGTSKAEFDKGAWKYVPAGTCATTSVTLPDGTKRNGSLQPIKS